MSKRRTKPVRRSPPTTDHRKIWPWVAVVAVGIALLIAARTMRSARATTEQSPPVSNASAPVHEMPASSQFLPTVENKARPAGPAPEGMVWIPGGEFSMGAQDPPDRNDTVGMQATADSRPVHRAYVDGFWMDATEVTNEQFARFVKATAYVTVAERTPRAEDFPGAPAENLVAGSVVFAPADHAVPLDDHFRWWT